MRTPEEILEGQLLLGDGDLKADILHALRTMQRETIEACAKVAKNYNPYLARTDYDLATAIRNLAGGVAQQKNNGLCQVTGKPCVRGCAIICAEEEQHG